MITLIPPTFVPQPVTRDDLVIASLSWGFTIGFGWLTTWTAIKQTRKRYQRNGWRVLWNAYVWMIWLEILVCLIFSVICWLHLYGIIPPSFAFYFTILTTWALQVQFLLQIIINRCAVLLQDQRQALRLKIGVAILITAVNISVYNIWIPARLQTSQRYIWINDWWDRCEKVIYLLVDGCLNFYFIRIVERNLVAYGLSKYKPLARFNMFIVGFSLSMDVLIISMMSLSNTFVYMQFHPFAYIVKLKIEMSMADLIGTVAKHRQAVTLSTGTTLQVMQPAPNNFVHCRSSDRRRSSNALRHVTKGDMIPIELQITKEGSDVNHPQRSRSTVQNFGGKYFSSSMEAGSAIYTTQEETVEVESDHSCEGTNSLKSFDEMGSARKGDNDTRPLRHN